MRKVFTVSLAAVICLAAILAASPARAQLKPSSPVFVVDVSTDQTRMAVVSAATFNEALTPKPPPPGQATPLERIMDACTTPDTVSTELTDAQREALRRRLELLTELKKCVDCLKAHQETRYFTDRGQEVALIVLFADPVRVEHIRPYFHEVPRDSELVATAKALAKLVRESVGLDCRAFTYTLQRRRSTFKITLAGLPTTGSAAPPSASGKPRPGALIEPEPAPDAQPAAAQPVRADVITPEVILGPIERWFFSADFSFSAGDVQLGKTPEADAEQLKNKDFFVGLNFSLGDLLADREGAVQRRSIWREIVLKAQLTPSREPWEAWAVGVGLRGYRIRTILWNMDVVHPYFTVGRQKGEDDTRRWRAVFGLGFDPRSLKK